MDGGVGLSSFFASSFFASSFFPSSLPSASFSLLSLFSSFSLLSSLSLFSSFPLLSLLAPLRGPCFFASGFLRASPPPSSLRGPKGCLPSFFSTTT